jgi:hypothetical protein
LQDWISAPRIARRALVIIGAAAFAVGCHHEEPPSATSAAPPAPSEAPPVEALRPPSSGDPAAPPGTPPSASAAEHVPDPANKMRPPLASPDLQERATHLLAALVANDPKIADDFFFPKAPFIPLKDVTEPGRYFDQLLATYHRDIATLRSERKDWTGAEFVSFELGTPPTWVAPGKEYNKIGYYRTFGGKLRYRIGDKTKEITVSTIISWDGRWYVTHLSPIKH